MVRVVLVVNLGLGGLAAVGQIWPLLMVPVFLVGGVLLWWLYRGVYVEATLELHVV